MRGFLRPMVLAVPALLALLGCGGRGTDTAGVVVTDSSSVELVFVSRAISGSLPTLDVVEELRIGTVDGPPETQFFTVAGIAEGRNGDLFVLDAGNRAVRVFDRTGVFLREIGGEGGGPGKFERPYALGFNRDSLVVLDRRLIHVFSSDGTLLQAHQHSLPGRQMPWTVTGSTEGWITGIRQPLDRTTTPPGGPFVDMFWFAMLDGGDGSIGSPLHEVPVRITYQVGRGVVRPLFGSDGQYAVNPIGEIFSSEGGEYVIEVRAARGGLIRRLRVETTRIPVTDADMDQHMAAELSALGGPGGTQSQPAEDFERLFPQLPRPEYRPVAGRILASADRILVERLDLDPDPFEEGDSTRWDMIGADGYPIGRVEVPAVVQPLLLTDSALFCVVRDELGVESVARFGIGT